MSSAAQKTACRKKRIIRIARNIKTLLNKNNDISIKLLTNARKRDLRQGKPFLIPRSLVSMASIGGAEFRKMQQKVGSSEKRMVIGYWLLVENEKSP